MGDLKTPPGATQIEVSLFGPGYGECLVVHLGHGQWLIVDSCAGPTKPLPAPLKYLQDLGVDVAKNVILVVATHWHDDHIRGLARVVQACASARFVLSEALTSKEFGKLVTGLPKTLMTKSSKVDEFAEILKTLGSRKAVPGRAIADRALLTLLPAGTQRLIKATVHSLSPSDVEIARAQATFEKLMVPGAPARVPVAPNPNNTAVVLWVEVGTRRILLGSDLEETSDNGSGWSVIVDSTNRPSGSADVFKVAHHGSDTAEQPAVWSQMLSAEKIAVLSPFVRGSVRLPTIADAERILAATPRAFLTALPVAGRSSRYSGASARTIRESTRSFRELVMPMGHVRLRADAMNSSDWSVDLFDAALPLQDFKAALAACSA